MNNLSFAAGLALAVAACTCRAQSSPPVHPAALGLPVSQGVHTAGTQTGVARGARLAQDHLHLASYVQDAAHSLSILDASGLVVHRLAPSRMRIATSSLPPGAYVLEARDASGKTMLVRPFLIGEAAAPGGVPATGSPIVAGH